MDILLKSSPDWYFDFSGVTFFDLETTGLERPGIVEIGYTRDGYVRSELINPGKKISPWAQAVHGISQEMVVFAPTRYETPTRTHIEGLVEKGHFFVAHNASFDVGVLRQHGVTIQNYVCSMRLAQYVQEEVKIPFGSVWLQNLRKYYEKERQDLREHYKSENGTAGAHRGGDDVLVMRIVFECLISDLCRYKNLSTITIEELRDLTNRPRLLRKLPFGKYTGIPLEELVKKDKRYMERLRKSELSKSPEQQNTDLLSSLGYYLEGMS